MSRYAYVDTRMRVYVYTYVCVRPDYICVYLYIHICIYTEIFVFMHMSFFICVHILYASV